MSTHKARVEPAPPPATEAPPATAPTLTHYSSSVQSVGQRRASFIAEHLQDPPPEQIFRAASPAFMLWLLEELTARDPKAKLDSISTHDLTMGAAFKLKMHKKTGFGYGPPETEACIRSLTKEGKTSVYKFITSTGGLTWRKAGTSQPAGVELTDADGRLSKMLQEKTEMDEDECYEMDEDECYGFGIIDLHAKHFVKVGDSYYQSQTRWRYQAAQPLRDKLVNRFGDEWWKKCFGPATHFASHAWDCSFAGLIEAIRGLPTWAFVWVDVIAINQHHAAQDERTADLGSLEHVIRHTGRVHLYFEPLQKAKAITRLWVLFELATNFDAHGELSLGFSKDGYDTLMSVAKELAKEFEFEDDLRRAPARAKVLDNALYHIKSSRAKARIKEDEDRIKGIIKSRPGGEKAFDELIKDEVIAVIDATKWAERCKECYSEYSLARVLEEALPLFITRKHAFHQLLKQEGAASLALAITPVEEAKPDFFRLALKIAMNKFGDEEKKRLKAKKESSTANRRRSIAIQRVGAASQRRLELKSLGVLIMSTRASVGQGLASGSTRQPIGEQQPRKSGWRFSRRSSQSARESVRSSARDSQSRLSAAPLPVPVVALQGHWRQIYDLLLDSSDDATLREVARQAFADNPQKVVDHAGWLAEQLHAAEQLSAAQKRRGGSSSRVDGSSSWSDVNVKVEVLRLFANLLPDQLQSPEGALVVDSTLCTLNALAAAPPSPSPSRQKTNAPPGSDAPSPAELRADLVTFAKQILHKAPRITLEPLAKKLVDLALQPEDPELHAEGRQLLQKLGVKQRQEAAKAMLDILKEAPAPAGPTKSEPFTSLLTALAHDNPTVLSPHVDTLMELAASESKLAASVAAETLPGMAQDANIFGQLVKQVEAKDVDADKVVNALTLIGKLDPALISRHDKAQLFFRRCLWHKDRKVFLLFENAILGKEGWTGALLAPFCSLLIEAMEAAAGAGGEDRRQSLVRALAKLSVNVLMPHLDALRGLMEREEIHGVRLAMLKLPPSIRDQCLSVGWLGDLNPTYN